MQAKTNLPFVNCDSLGFLVIQSFRFVLGLDKVIKLTRRPLLGVIGEPIGPPGDPKVLPGDILGVLLEGLAATGLPLNGDISLRACSSFDMKSSSSP